VYKTTNTIIRTEQQQQLGSQRVVAPHVHHFGVDGKNKNTKVSQYFSIPIAPTTHHIDRQDIFVLTL